MREAKHFLILLLNLLENKVNNIRFINARFEDAFPQLIQEIDKLDVLYVDGNHTYEATLTYFKQALQKNTNTLFLFLMIYTGAKE